jgi:hypothetical protein
MTKGEYRAGIDFNPSSHAGVSHIKAQVAQLIDLIDEVPVPQLGGDEVEALKELAMRAVEEGGMWAVKAVTKKPME